MPGMVTSDKGKRDRDERGDQYANAADGDPNYTTDVHTVTEAEADEAERERNEQLADAPTPNAGPHYNAHLDADGPGGTVSANQRTDGKDSPSFEERTGQKTETGRTAQK